MILLKQTNNLSFSVFDLVVDVVSISINLQYLFPFQIIVFAINLYNYVLQQIAILCYTEMAMITTTKTVHVKYNTITTFDENIYTYVL